VVELDAGDLWVEQPAGGWSSRPPVAVGEGEAAASGCLWWHWGERRRPDLVGV
jgi:hypothetical protein